MQAHAVDEHGRTDHVAARKITILTTTGDRMLPQINICWILPEEQRESAAGREGYERKQEPTDRALQYAHSLYQTNGALYQQ